MRDVERELTGTDDDRLIPIAASLWGGIEALEEAVRYIIDTYSVDVKKPLAGSVPFLELLGVVACGWQMARAALVASQRLLDGAGDLPFHQTKLHTARFYADHVLSRASGLVHAITVGADSALAIDDADF